MTVVLTGRDLTIDGVVRVARRRERVELARQALARMAQQRALVEQAVERGDAVYGTTTGVGVRKRVRVDPREAAGFNRRLLLDHRVGQGPAASEDVVRGTMLRLANGFASGVAGVRPALAERLVDALNEGEAPRVRTLGTTGIGDVAPLADLAHGLFATTELAAKEGIALLNSSAFTTSLATLALADARRFADVLKVAAALDLEAFAANVAALHPRIAEVRPQPSLARALEDLRDLLASSALWTQPPRNLQDPLVFRCLPQVQGALAEALAFAVRHVETELNASQDNPLPVPDEGRVLSVGNFDLLALAQALDLARISLASALTSACERSLKLLQAPFTGLTEGLAARAGDARSGLSEFAFTAQALTAEARLLAAPVSYEVVSTTQAEGIEDRMTMAPLAARRLAAMVELGERLCAVGLLLACQAVDLRGGRLGAGSERAYRLVRERVSFTEADDAVPHDLDPLVELVRSGDLADVAHASTRMRPSSTRTG